MAASPSTSPGAFVTSSSSYHPSWTYDVFLSFRGEDTRKGFTDHLYHALTDAGIYTFRDDDELRRGEDLSSELLSAIEGSRFSVVVISRNYVASRWCRDELVKIMECRRLGGFSVLPVFYHVDPSDVRHQNGSFAEAFAKHEERYSLDKDKLHRWRAALKDVSNLTGWHVDGRRHEAQIICEIVHWVLKQVTPTLLSVAVYPVGIDPRVKEVISFLCIEDGAVRMVGIWGMGGIGKTSISKAIYNKFFHSFEAVSFIANIRETCKQSDGQVRLQEQLLSDTLKTSKIKISSVDNGITIIKKRLCRRKVLVILDDVSEVEQVDAIARSHDCFGPGSRIVITTRNEQLLKGLEVDATYTAKKMNDREALELFSWHAFRKSCPTEDFMDLSRSIISYCGGLPLALEVLGSHLFSRKMPEWISALEKLKIIPREKIQTKLKISFDGLNDSTMEDMFLDIACFFIGINKNYVTQIMNGCGFCGGIGVEVLIERCLLSIDQGGKLAMHDLLRDMGREIVRKEKPKEPGKRSRVWQHEDAIDILVEYQGKKAIEGLAIKLPSLSSEDFDTRAFKKMKRLRLLQLDYVRLTGDYKHLSEKLRWLRWHGFPLEFMPNNFHPRHSVAIDLRHSNLKQVWKTDKQLFEKLKFLNLSHSHFLTQTPNFARLPNLEELVLKDCTSLFEVHESIGDLSNLVLLDFEGCKNLESLPRCLYLNKSLQTLVLSGCPKIKTLPEEFGEMESLTTFLAEDIATKQLPCTITKLKKLKYLSLWDYTGLPARLFDSIFWSQISPRGSPSSVNLLPASQQGLNSVRELCLTDCSLLNDGIIKGLSTSRSFGSSKLQTFRLNYFTKHQSIPGSDKLWKSTAMIHDERCNNTSKQSIFQECAMSRFGTFLRGNDIPNCFMCKEGSSICFEVPCNTDCDLEGFIVCIVYSASCVDKTVAEDLPSMTIMNSTKNRIQTKRPVAVDEVIFPEDHIWGFNVSRSSFNLEGGDKIKVSVDFGSRVTVQKIGVCLVYGSVHGKMIDYQSTSNKDVIVVHDDKDASKDQVTVKFKRTCSDDNAESSHGGFDSRGAKRLRCENDIDDTAESSNG